MKKYILLTASLLLLLLGLPLTGVLATGKQLRPYLEFPPLTQYVAHAPFSWSFFVALAVIGFLVIVSLVFQLTPKQPMPKTHKKVIHYLFPWWGFLGLLLVGSGWILAWNRFSWFAPYQAYTFLPLWLGYVLAINSVTYYRSGTCIMTAKPRYFLSLFPVSAFFWWFFEYLNRFVQNWYYLGTEDFSAAEYILHASLCFSTVLPAVLSTEELLGSIQRFSKPLKKSSRIDWSRIRFLGYGLFLVSVFGLATISIWTDYLFPLLWLSPLLIIISVQKIMGQSTFFAPMSQGDWRPLWLPAISALVCGFFWELWNFKSYAHWVYSIPFVQKFYIFEMPILGYLGYLPFGLECKAVANLIEKMQHRS